MSDQYYYELLGQEFGPVTLSALELLVRGGQLGPDDRVRLGENGTWCAASTLRELVSVPSDDSSVLEELSDLSEIDADYSGDSHILTGGNNTNVADGGSGSSLSKSSIEVAEEQLWFCQVLGEELGPMTMADLRHMVETEELGAADLVRSKDREGWAPASMLLGELFPDASLDDLLASAPDSSAEIQLPDMTASGAQPAAHDAPDFELSDSALISPEDLPPVTGSDADDDSEFELADNVQLVDSADNIKLPAAPAAQQTPVEPVADVPAAEEPDESDADSSFKDLDDDDKEDWEAALYEPSGDTATSTPASAGTPTSDAARPAATQPKDSSASESQRAAADLVNKAAMSMQADIDSTHKPPGGGGFSMSLPDMSAIPVEALLKLVALIALCVGGFYGYKLLPISMDLPTMYVRLTEIHAELETLPESGPTRDDFVAASQSELEKLRKPLEGRTSSSDKSAMEMNFASGALLYLVIATDEDEIEAGQKEFRTNMKSAKFALVEDGADASTLPDVEQ